MIPAPACPRQCVVDTCVINKWLSVSGKPRRNGPVPEKPPIANVVDKPVAVTFYLLAYPTPKETEYRYHGRVGNASDEGKVVEKDMFTTHCWTTGALYNVSCNVTTNITSDEEEGVYSVSIGNTFGRATFSFIVTFNGKSILLATKHQLQTLQPDCWCKGKHNRFDTSLLRLHD